MFTGSAKELTDLSRRFTEPANATHRQYEALRAYFVEGLSGVEAARRFGYTPGSFRVLVHQFRRDPDRPFFVPPAKGPQAAPKADPVRDRIVALRKQNLSIYDISRALHDEGHPARPGRRLPGPQGRGVRPPPPPRRRRAPAGSPAHHGRCRRRPAARPDPPATANQVRRAVPVPPDPGLDPVRPHRPPGGVARVPHDPGGLRPPLPARPEALRHRPPPPRHERRAGRGAGPLRRAERHPQAVLPDGVQLPHRPGLLPEADAPLVRRHERARARARHGRSTWTSTPSPITATTPWSRSTTSPSGAAARRGSWPSSPRTPTPASSATPTPSCARPSRATRSSASSGSGSSGPDTTPTS